MSREMPEMPEMPEIRRNTDVHGGGRRINQAEGKHGGGE